MRPLVAFSASGPPRAEKFVTTDGWKAGTCRGHFSICVRACMRVMRVRVCAFVRIVSFAGPDTVTCPDSSCRGDLPGDRDPRGTRDDGACPSSRLDHTQLGVVPFLLEEEQLIANRRSLISLSDSWDLLKVDGFEKRDTEVRFNRNF